MKHSFPLFAIYWPFLDPKKLTWCHIQGHNFTVSGDIAPKFQKNCLRYWWCLLSNFTPIGEVPVEKTVTEQKKQRNSKLSIPPILHMEGLLLKHFWIPLNQHRVCVKPYLVKFATFEITVIYESTKN